MNIYIALLRGINVGGKNIIRMKDLKQMFEALGLLEVQTYIQSGNVLFKSEEEEETLRRKIENAIENTFGFPSAVVLRTAKELERIVSKCPFSKEEVEEAEASSEAECLYVALLGNEPSEEKIQSLQEYRSESDDFITIGRDVFLLFHHSIRNSKLANNLHRLDVPATVRNWKTINKLFLLARTMGY